ncbi:hypothetical protein M9Y10_026248 [Tritrichomonas musculus]|uniref:DUF3447 domain-containing protein n=1 Tax=Tritrichomonas musculus TaxID=1915356 RepID=A0ABR2H854_9EUKA
MQEYIEKKKEFYDSLLEFLENIEYDVDYFQGFIKIIKQEKLEDDCQEFEEFLRLLNNIINYHHRNENFIIKVEQIFDYFSVFILKNFTNLSIFNIFKNNKIVLYILITRKIIVLDNDIIKVLFLENDSLTKNICQFFFPEIQQVVKESLPIEYLVVGKKKIEKIEKDLLSQDENIFNNFDQKRKIGENDSYICSLIRQDSIEEFVSYVNRTNYSISSEIKYSIFETNLFLIESNPTLIEYAAFFGSIQIFQYLKFNGVELNSNLWKYSIHSQNSELIHFLEISQILPPNKQYEECLKESIKCHHNDIANYIENNFITENELYQKEDFFSMILCYRNFSFFPSEFGKSDEFFYLCKYNYNKLVKLFLETKAEYFISYDNVY